MNRESTQNDQVQNAAKPMGKMKNQLERGAVHSYRTHHHFDRSRRANRLTSRIERGIDPHASQCTQIVHIRILPGPEGQIGSHRAARAQIVHMRSESGREGRLHRFDVAIALGLSSTQESNATPNPWRRKTRQSPRPSRLGRRDTRRDRLHGRTGESTSSASTRRPRQSAETFYLQPFKGTALEVKKNDQSPSTRARSPPCRPPPPVDPRKDQQSSSSRQGDERTRALEPRPLFIVEVRHIVTTPAKGSLSASHCLDDRCRPPRTSRSNTYNTPAPI